MKRVLLMRHLDNQLYTVREPGGQYSTGHNYSLKGAAIMTELRWARIWGNIKVLKAHLTRVGLSKYKSINAEVVAFELAEDWTMSIDDLYALRKMQHTKRAKYLEVLTLRGRIERAKRGAMSIPDMAKSLHTAEHELALM
jgi:hypothetical protein